MTKIYKNGDTVIRVSEISAVCIPEDNPRAVKVFLRATNTIFQFQCNSIKEALDVLENIKNIILNEDKEDLSNE